ncbi:UDP-glucuronosyl and UDP-glucosyl transferase [Handroanthus impetiginosus]|uniref:UDP-glucuronosyl and UDP-glucosyl transferase n=1 Tax=Handroanthus impetiginosus TaxID=429701 RepID=A0A2G9FV31_9LAMI|nr:UDP-glucuronosyl and UDP-glucosyl transferase [Handroanthus impetiginosus]
MDSLKKAFDGLETGLTRFLEDSRPDWVIQDFASHWVSPIAARLGISRAFFCIMNAWFLAFLGPTNAIISGSDDRIKPEDFMVPPKWVKFETKVAYRRFEADWIVGSSQNEDSGFSDFYRVGKVMFEAEVILPRHCYEFEPDWLTVVEELHHKPIIPLGLMPPEVQEDEDPDEIWAPIRNWLDSQNKGSVVYVALGSEVMPSQHQLTELVHGLELSGVPFFLVQRKPSRCIESDSMKLPDGFEERVTGQGIVWKSWVPQLKILSHESVGGFLTHCGWSSIVEGLTFGHPLITLPFFVDHGLTSRIIVEKQLGIEIPRDEQDGSFTRNSVVNSIKLVMLEDDGKKFKERAKEVSAIFGNTELHGRYIDNFVEFLENHKYVNKDI